MPGKQAKVLKDHDIANVLRFLKRRRHNGRDQVIFLLSLKAGLRAGEIAQLTWSMLLTPDGHVGNAIELEDRISKKRSGRTIPLNPDLKKALTKLFTAQSGTLGTVILSERRRPMTPATVANWFARLYGQLNLTGCSSHSGRRTFITRAAKIVERAGGSLRDVQQLAGHRSINMTQSYIEGDTKAKNRLVAMI